MDFLSGFKVNADDLRIMFNIVLGLIAGVIIAGSYILGHKEKRYSKNFAITILLLPAIMTVVIPFIATDLKKAVSLAGIFALVRFRSIPGDSKDILYVFFTLAVGIVMGLNNYIVAYVLTIVVSLAFVLLQRYWKNTNHQVLKITIPEDMNYHDAFDDIFEKYLLKAELYDVKTTNMGTLFVVTYSVNLKDKSQAKQMIDELRTRNGNLNIVLQVDPSLFMQL